MKWFFSLFKYFWFWVYLSLLTACATDMNSESLWNRLKPIVESPAKQLDPLALQHKGYVIAVQDQKVFVDLGARDGLNQGMLLGIYRQEGETVLRHPVTGEILTTLKNEFGTIRILEVSDKFSIGRLESLVRGAEIYVGDRVFPIDN